MGGCLSAVGHQDDGKSAGIWQRLLHCLKLFINRRNERGKMEEPTTTVDEFEEIEGKKKKKLVTNKNIDKNPPRARREIFPKIELTEQILDEFVDLEKKLRRLERKGIVEKFEAKMTEIDEFCRTLAQMEATQKELKKEMEKAKAELENLQQPGVKVMLRRVGTMNEKMENARQHFEEALAKEEMAEKELKATKSQYEKARQIADLCGEFADRMEQMFGREQQILGGIFAQEFVGLKQLDELDAGMEWRERIEMAKFKWTNARVLLVHASTQIAFGISHWKELSRLDPLNAARMRYFSAAEARNNFQSAAQNIQTCRVYLDRVKFPYGTEEEMQQMEDVLQNAFNDVQSNAALKRALTFCQGTHKSVHSLILWFDKVISETILKDLDMANSNVLKRQKQLRELGLEMMGKMVREKFGRELKIEGEENENENEGEKGEFEQRLQAIEAKKTEKVVEEGVDESLKEMKPMQQSDNVEEEEEEELTKEEMRPNSERVGAEEEINDQPSASSQNENSISLPLDDQLAPIPPKEVLFEQIQQKLAEFQQIRAAQQRRNEFWRERQRMVLQEKLRIRREQKRRRPSNGRRRKSSIQPFPSSFSESMEEEF